jgi:hypothetical protein
VNKLDPDHLESAMTETPVTNQGHTYGYKAFYKGREIELYSDTIYHAQLKAANIFGIKPNKRGTHLWQVSVALCEKDGEEVIHIAC